MIMDIKNDSIISVEQLQDLIKAAETLGVESFKRLEGQEPVYQWMNDLLIRLRYALLRKKDKSVVRRYLQIYSGYGISHIDHLITRYGRGKKLIRAKRTQFKFQTKYTREDIALLAEVAEAYHHQNGKALRGICQDMYNIYGDARFVRLKDISTSRLYDLKRTSTYRNLVVRFEKTRPVSTPIGERKKPQPEGRPGFIRVDSVHQGDLEGEKGLYHINLVDEVTQWEVVCTVEGISEEFLRSALETALGSFPFRVLNFHSDNGSEYINKTVAKLLEKLRISQTKSRSRRTNDQALVEGKNGSVIRPMYGHCHIAGHHASKFETFNRSHFNHFINFHRKSAFPDEEVDERGKIIKKYRTYLTPCEKLLSLNRPAKYLVQGVTVEALRAQALKTSHLDAAQAMQKAKTQLFKNLT